jgi:probable F420-dependent oxidoreductase
MKAGVCIPHFGNHLSRGGVVNIARKAEELGFDSLWVTDHIMVNEANKYPYGRIYEALTTLSAVAVLTSKITIGTSIIVLPMRNPVIVAKQLATIDHLCEGRLIAGFAAGWCEPEFRNLGAEFRNRGRRLSEAIRLIRALWSSARPKFKGAFYTIEDAVFEPLPYQSGGPPIWLGGNSMAAFRRALKLADGWHPTGLAVEEYAQRVAMAKGVKEGFTFSGRLTVDFGAEGKRVSRSPTGEKRVILGGRPSEVAEDLAQYKKAGMAHCVLYFGDVDEDEYAKRMDTFAHEVRPSL